MTDTQIIDQKKFAERAGLEDSRIVAKRIIEAFTFPTEEEQDRMDARAAERATAEREAAANFAFYTGESEDVTF